MTGNTSSSKLDRCLMPIKNDTEEEAKEYFLNAFGYIEALIVTMIISCLALFLMVWAVCVICRQKRMSSLVRKYFFIEYASRLYLILFFQLYINPLLFWPEEIGKTPAFVDTLITYFYSVFTLSCPFAQMALSCNRFLAVAFNGRLYHLMSQRETLQVVVLIVAPLLLHFPQLLPWCSPYNTDCYEEVEFGGYCPGIAWITTIAASIFGLLTIIMDICVWRMLKKRRKDAHLLNNPGEKSQRRLCRHMLLNHVSTLIIGLIVSIISGSLTNNVMLQAVIQTNLHVPIAAVVQGLILIWFLQSYRCCATIEKSEMPSNEETMRTNRAVSISAPISRQKPTLTKMSSVQI